MNWNVWVSVGALVVGCLWLAAAQPGAAQQLSAEPDRIEAVDNNSAFIRSKLQVAYEHERGNDAVRTDLARLTAAKTFGDRSQFGVLVALPYLRIKSATGDIAGVGDLGTKVSWRFYQDGRLSQAVAFGVEWATAEHQPALGGSATYLAPQYAFNYVLNEVLAFTGQITYVRGVAAMPFVDVSTLTIEPILIARLPAGWYVSADPKLSWSLSHHDRPQPMLRYTLGRLFGPGGEWNAAIYGQSALNAAAAQALYRQMFGASLTRFF